MTPNSSSVAREIARPLPWHSTLPALLPTLVAGASLISLLLLVQMSGVTVTGYDLRQLEETRADWERNNYLMEAYIADLQSLERIEHVAQERLRMVPATEHVFLTLPVSPLQTVSRPEEFPPAHVKRPAPPRNTGGERDRPFDGKGLPLASGSR